MNPECAQEVVLLYLRLGLYAVVGLGCTYLALLSAEYGSRAGAGMNMIYAILFWTLAGFLLFSECSQFESRVILDLRGKVVTVLLIALLPFQWAFLIRRARGRRK